MLSLDPLPLAFDRRDAMRAGWTRHQFHRRVAAPDVVEVAPRLFADALCWRLAGRDERHVALARHAESRYSGAVVSHASAALLHGLPSPRFLHDAVVLTCDKERAVGDDAAWVRLQRSGLPDRLTTEVGGVRVTSLARTAVDCLRVLPRMDGLAIADAVVRRGVEPAELVAVRTAQARWPGVRTARWGIGVVDGRRESWLESASVAVLDGWLPLPLPQVVVRDRASGAFLGRVDNLWRGLRVVGEADGVAKFRGLDGADTSEQAVVDRLIAASVRADRLRDVGLGVVRWGPSDLRAPGELSARVRAARPTGPCRAEFSCGVCGTALEDCRCAPALLLPRSAREAA